jgi:hypothetical protein
MSEKLKNGDLKANPSKNNLLNVRLDVCKCGKTVCDYTVEVTAAVAGIFLGQAFNGMELALPAASYAVTAAGAATLKKDLLVLLDGVVQSVAVTLQANGADPDSLLIVIAGSLVAMGSINGTADFVKTNCKAASA